MTSKLSKEGYLFLDHSNSPGMTEAEVHCAGLPPGAGHGIFEAPTYTCSHCCTVVILNPNRRRDRAYCIKCNRYICDQCGAIMAHTGKCLSFEQVCDEVREAASAGHIVEVKITASDGIIITTKEV